MEVIGIDSSQREGVMMVDETAPIHFKSHNGTLDRAKILGVGENERRLSIASGNCCQEGESSKE